MSDLLQSVADWTSGAAIISGDARYRYSLRRGNSSGRLLHWVMLNPSTADATFNDHTIRKCIGFAQRSGFSGITVHNLFAVRATDPLNMKTLDDPVGPENHTHISRMLGRAIGEREPIVCAWGKHGSYMGQNETTVGWLEEQYPRFLWCLGKNVCGNPKHPLTLSYTTPFVRMDGKT